MSLPVVGVLVALLIGIFIGYDAERWDRSVNGWSLAGAVLNVPALAVWLVIRHREAERRRQAGEPVPLGFLRWLRRRRRLRAGGHRPEPEAGQPPPS